MIVRDIMMFTLFLMLSSMDPVRSGEMVANSLGIFDPPTSKWKPEGIRLASKGELMGRNALPRRDRFTTIHGTTRCDDNVGGTVLAPVFSETFTVEERAYVAEGPTFLADDTILFTPTIPSMNENSTTNHLLIALDGVTGERLWTVGPSQYGQGGAPLVLRDPDTKREVVFAAGVEKVVAVDGLTGSILWETQTGLPNDPSDHCFGISYHPQTDSVLVLFLTGYVQSYDRVTGQQNDSLDFGEEFGSVPVGMSESSSFLPDLDPNAQEALQGKFDIDLEQGSIEVILQILTGVSVVIANFFSCDPDSGNIFIIATVEDGHEGDTKPGDGFSEAAALYILEMDAMSKFKLKCTSSPIPGGSATTPTISADGKRIYIADNSDKFFGFDSSCNHLYSVDIGFPILASFSATPNNGEIFAPTKNGVLKVVESEDRNSAVGDMDYLATSQASLTEAFKKRPRPPDDGTKRVEVINASITTSAENAIAVIASIGFNIESDNPMVFVPFDFALVLLDRETGELINASPMREETVASLSPNSSGVMVLGNSPARRLFFSASQEQAMNVVEAYKPLTGGITMYGVAERYDLIVRDASCAAASRLSNLLSYQEDDQLDQELVQLSAQTDLIDVKNLIDQALRASDYIAEETKIDNIKSRTFSENLKNAYSDMDRGQLEAAEISLSTICENLVKMPLSSSRNIINDGGLFNRSKGIRKGNGQV